GGASLDVVKAYIENQRKPPSEKQIKQSLTLLAKGRLLA
ncbi:IS200/IS605 family transposase, partial [bacterium]|nr:IS200/IS605 family transposase [bacterium]